MGVFDDLLGGGLLGLAGDIWSADQARQGAREANRQNYRIFQEGNAFTERMSNSAYQRSVADMKKAGLNPMLAIMKGGASTPSSASATMDNEKAQSSEIMSGAIPKMLAIQQAKSNIELTNAQADKAKSEATMTRDQIPFSASNASLTNEKLDAETSKVANEVRQQLLNIEISELTRDQLIKLQPLVLEAQQIANNRERFGLSEAQAMSKFYEAAGGAGKWAELVRMVLGLMGRK